MCNIPSQERLSYIPRLYGTESTPIQGKLVYLHFFIGGCDWYICEYDGDDLFFGYAVINGDVTNAEWGHVSFHELRDISIHGIEADCESEDLWSPKPVSEIFQIMQGRGSVLKPLCKLIGEDSNVFNLIDIVRSTLKRHDLYQQLEDFDSDLKLFQELGGTYEDVLAMFLDYVEVV